MKNVRLDLSIIPVRYEIFLRPNLDSFTFSGSETIEIEIAESVSEITLHSAELDITSAQIVQASEIQDCQIFLDEKDETLLLKFKNPLIGHVSLKLEFTGVLNDKMRGFYRSSYVLNDETKWLATTQFESTDARRAFPCFDEPDKKAIFDVSVQVPSHLSVISNTIESEIIEHNSGIKVVKFQPTPKMSTYLLAIVVGELEYIEDRNEDGILVRVFVTPGKSEQGRFALKFAKQALHFYNQYFGINYPLPVLDLIATPDFAAGAMENWGAVTFRETALLIDENLSAANNKQRVAIVIAHELAHMWFGDLVTMNWWTHLWLNEGFATYMEYLCVDAIFPEWDIWTQFVFSDFDAALNLDSLVSTHPVEVEVHHPSEIGEIFDKVSYSKGASIIRMLASYIGDDDFRGGLQKYLEKHKYANASTEDLWTAFSDSSGKDIAKIMKEWTSKPGYPLLSVRQINNQIEISQSRFFSSKPVEDQTIWNIPLQIYTKQKIQTELLTAQSQSFGIAEFKLNHNEVSFVRVMYSKELMQDLKANLTSLSVLDRLGLIRDLFALSFSGHISVTEALDFCTLYKDETDFTIWAIIASNLGNIQSLLSETDQLTQFNAFAMNLFKSATRRVGAEVQSGEPHTTTMLRSLLLLQSVVYGDQEIIDKLTNIFDTSTIKSPIHPDIRRSVYAAVANRNKLEDFEILTSMHKSEQNQQEKDRIMAGLAGFSNPTLSTKAAEYFISENVRNQDAVFGLSLGLMNDSTRRICYQFIKANWAKLLVRYQGTFLLLAHIVEALDNFSDQDTLDEIKHFFATNPHSGIDRTLEQMYEKIQSNIDWLKRDLKKIKQFLNS